MKRPWQIWMLYLLCLAFVLPGLLWLTLKANELDRSQTEARRQAEEARGQAELQEVISSTLWRMDWVLTPIIAQETARPYYVYDPFYSATPDEQPQQQPGQQVPSPLLVQPSEYVLLHFQVGPDQSWTSPQNPIGVYCDIAIQQGTPPENISTSGQRLAELKQQINYTKLLENLPAETLPKVKISSLPWGNNLSFNYDGSKLAQQDQSSTQDFGLSQLNEAQQDQPDDSRQQSPLPAQESNQTRSDPSNELRNSLPVEGRQQSLSTDRQAMLRQNDWHSRNRAYESYAKSQIVQQRSQAKVATPVAAATEGVSRPLWIDEKLILARRFERNRQTLIQGVWLDWPRLKDMLMDEIDEALAGADLVPVSDERSVQPSRMLATIPVRLTVEQTPVSATTISRLSPIQWSLILAWLCLVLAAAAVAILLQGVVTLSERRGAFVSAVTHELRTPLTTFRMYAEMLAEGMVPDAQRRQQYVETLRVEADRLAHLVENVLSYARLERGRNGHHRQKILLKSLIQQVETRLVDRAAHAQMTMEIDADDKSRHTTLLTDPSAVEQILFNLVDNACKYAHSAADQRIHLVIRAASREVQFAVRDHGPGVTAHDARRLFRPFSKSVQQAADSTHGVGLGLALSRRHAISLGGRLEMQSPEDGGAEFILTLPL